MVLLSFLSLFMSNYIIWWGLFVLVTTVGLFKLNNEMVSHSVIAHYFFIQELAGIVFVMSLTENILVLALAVKGGFAPFQYWIIKVVRSVGWSSVIWFLTMQNMVYYFLIPLFLDCNWICVLFVGSFITLFQALLSRSVVMIVFLLLVSSGNFILLLGIWDYVVSLYMCILYLVYMYLFLKGGLSLNYELFFVLMGIPGSLPFFVKLLSLCYVVGGGSLLVFVFLAFFFINGVLCYHLIVGSYTLGFSGKLFQVYFVSLFLGIVWFF